MNCPDCNEELMISTVNGRVCLTPTCSNHFLLPTSHYVKKQDVRIIHSVHHQLNNDHVELSIKDATRMLTWHEQLWKLAVKYKALEEQLESLRRR